MNNQNTDVLFSVATKNADGNYTFPAAITNAQVLKIEKAFSSRDVTRRLALGVLTRSSDQLAESVWDLKGGNAVLELAQSLDSTLEDYQRMLELLTSAHARLWLCLGQESDRMLATEGVDPAAPRDEPTMEATN